MTPESQSLRAGRRTFAGLFLVTLSTLTYQLLLTRTFSVTMYYHFAFVAISVTMFGMAVGALAVFLRPAAFAPARVTRGLAMSSAAFAIAIVLSYLTHLVIPFFLEASLVLGGHVRCEIYSVETGVAMLQIERLNIAMESETGNRTFARKKRSQPL